MIEFLREPLLETLEVTGVVFLIMVAVDLANIRLQGRLTALLDERPSLSYLVAALLALIPGCVGDFLCVTLYVHGALSFGALCTTMITTTGDESFLMLSLFPRDAVALFAVMALVGIAAGWTIDRVMIARGKNVHLECEVPIHHPGREGIAHFFKEHVVDHVLLHHLPRLFAWSFGCLVLAKLSRPWWAGIHASPHGAALLVVLAAVVGVIPSSGPHFLFVDLYAKGTVPLSMLVANSFSQTGHGVLPLLSVSVRDAVKVKVITLALGLAAGLLVAGLGH